jgi:uroporphyrinogen decarboxylase
MNSRERVLATMAGQATDRRPVSPVLCLYGARLTGCPLDQYFADPVAHALGQSAVRQVFSPDILFGPFAFAALGAAFGSELQFFADQPPNIRRPAIQSAREWGRLRIPDPRSHPGLGYLQEAVRLMVKEHGEEVLVAVALPPPTDLPALVLGMEGWLETVLFDREGAQQVMNSVIPFFVTLTEVLFEAGAAFLALTCGYASPAVVTRKIALNFTRPALARTLAQMRGPIVLHHAGPPILPNLDLLTGMPATVGFALHGRDDLSRARELVGPEAVLLSGPHGPDLPNLSATQVRAECETLLTDRRHDPRFILCTSGADIPFHTDAEKIHAVLEAAVAFGGGRG